MTQVDESSNIFFMCKKVDDIVTTCKDDLKGLTTQDSTKCKAEKTYPDEHCFCSEAGWKKDGLAERFREEIKGCPICDNSNEPKTLDVADIRGPCGKNDCRIARDMRYYIEDLAEEDDMMVNLDDLIGPCGSTECNFVKHLKDFIFHRGAFECCASADNPNGCNCTEQMEKALKEGYSETCTPECVNLDRIFFGGPGCVHKKEPTPTSKTDIGLHQTEKPPRSKSPANAIETQNVQNMFFLTVKLDDKPDAETKKSESKLKYCAPTCLKSDVSGKCTKSACDIPDSDGIHISGSQSQKCVSSACPNKEADGQESYTPSPEDSDVEINLADLRNPCNVKSCDASEKILEYIMKGLEAKKKCARENDDSCFCDCSRCKSKP